jgi:hypothetical protein
MLRKVLQSNDCTSLIEETCNFADLVVHHSKLTKVTDTSNMNRRSQYYLSIGAQFLLESQLSHMWHYINWPYQGAL